jgi:hypothetical protein
MKSLLASAQGSEKLKVLLRKRFEAARTVTEARFHEFLNGRGTLDFILEATKGLLKSELELCNSKEDRIRVWETHIGWYIATSTRYPLNPGLWKTRAFRNETVHR